ncbi:MAG: murein biosynthesis integral membrane protein MurJ [Coriobacteriales bacterium]|jgi:putative peptidoglycan lipid II flippase|nr:murein biosynthesis integral membrane protein MurJ [Coriobacteriales bacterium]
MVTIKRFRRLSRCALLSVLLACLFLVQVAGVTPARALDVPAPSTIETIRPIFQETAGTTSVALLYCPGLVWDRVDLDDWEVDALFGSSAIGNLSAPDNWAANALLEDSRVGLYRCNESGSLADAAADINLFIRRELPADCILIITTAPPFDGKTASHEFTPVLIRGGEFTGYLTSDSTHRVGLILATDLLRFAQGHLDGATDSQVFAERAIRHVPTSNDSAERIARLMQEKSTIDSMLATKAPANFAFLALVFIAFSLAIALFFLGRQDRRKTDEGDGADVGMLGTSMTRAAHSVVRDSHDTMSRPRHAPRTRKTSSRGVLIPAVRILWLIVLAFPPATFLMFTLLPAQPTPFDLVVAIVIWVAVISFSALLVGWRTKWVNSLIALYGLIIFLIVAGEVFGGPLDIPGYLTYDITEGSRYYGMGNEHGAILFGSWITLSGLLINRYPTARGIPAFKRWGYPLGSALLLFVATSPWLGASFGPLVWGFLGCFFSWWLFNGRRVRLWLVAVMVAAAFALALGVLYADVTFNPASHMSQVTTSMQEGFGTLVVRIATDVWTYSFGLMTNYVPAVIVVFLAFVFVLLVVLRVLQPGGYRQFWRRNTAFRAVYSVCFMLAAIMFILEDSAIFMPAVLIIYPVSCFVWLVCDLHSWHLRILAEHDAPITVRELQQRALELLTHEGVQKSAESVRSPAASPIGAHAAAPGDTRARTTRVESSYTPRHARPRHLRVPDAASSAAPASARAPVPAGAHTAAAAASQPSVARSTATMSAATLLSRVTGFVRTWAMAFALGNTVLTSAYSIANNLPNQLYELVAGGVLTTAFLPIYLAQLEKRGKDGATSYASNLLSIGAIILGVVVVVATIFAPQVVFTQTFLTKNSIDIQNAVFFFRFFAIQVIFYGVGAIIGSLLNAHRSFFWPALGPVFNNIVVIITLFGYPVIAQYSQPSAMIWLAVGTSLGVVAMFVVQIPALRKLKIPLRFHIDLRDPALKDTLKLALPAMVFIIMSLVAVSVMNACALNVTLKGPATIQYAWLWYTLPYGVIAVALSTALLTEMSEASAAENWEIFRTNVRLGLRSTIFLIIPLAAIIFTLSNQLAGLYHAGEFTYEDVLNVANVVAMWCVALPFYASYMFIYRVFSSMRDLKRFVIIDGLGRVLLAVLYGFFTTGFGLFEGLGLIGIPLADACVYALLCAVMLFVLRRRIGSFGLTGIVLDGGKILAAALVAVAIPFIISFGDFDSTILVSLVTIALCGIFALAVYYLLCRLFKLPEIQLVNSIASRVVNGLWRKR